MRDGFYHAFEERFRGRRAVVTSRLQVYLPFVEPLKEDEKPPRALDVGCGRGEWLELITHAGFEACGVDLDAAMLAECRQQGFRVQQGDAVAYLCEAPDESLSVISAFHLVEHLPFELVGRMVAEALRVLRPGGLLIMETPNPENIVVATRDFYLDPTHIRPLPPLLLSFLTEHCGFVRTKILRLQEAEALRQNASPSLNDVLGGGSPDYAVVAQKAAAPALLAGFDQAFEQDFGLLGHTLAGRYDAALQIRTQQIGEDVRAARIQADEALEAARVVQAEAGRAHGVLLAQVDQALEAARAAHATALEAREAARVADAGAVEAREAARAAEWRAGQAEAVLAAIYQSRSWRVTAPLRCLSEQASRAVGCLTAVLVEGVTGGYHLLNRNPSVKQKMLRLLAACPALTARLQDAVHRRISGNGFPVPEEPPAGGSDPSLESLNPRERMIFERLKRWMA